MAETITPVPVAIFFEDDGYVEAPKTKAPPKVPPGPIGRRVAGKEFLLAYLRYARSDPLYALVRDRRQQQALTEFCSDPAAEKRNLQTLLVSEFHQQFFPKSPVSVIHYPSPIEPKFTWARQYGGPTFALSGITHTISSAPAIDLISEMIRAPMESFDALICISRASVDVVRAVTGNYCDYLRDRFGGNPTLKPKLVNIPLGVDVEKYRPPTPQERAEQRAKLGVDEDEMVVLYLGRLLYHGKVHPFPMYQGLIGAAKAAGKKVRLVMAGWSPDRRILENFASGAQTFAPGITIQFLDGRLDEVRYRIWWAADVFAFPTDNIQETFPQSVIEAMACGLPVVATDWDGCRDQVVHGKTGFLVPTYSVPGATTDATSRLLMKEIRYDEFLGRCNQAVTVDIRQTAEAMMILFTRPELRAAMGQAGRQRAVNEFAWVRIIQRYEQLWSEQETQRQEFLKASADRRRSFVAPALFTPPEHSFRSYPSRIVGSDLLLRANIDAERRLDACLQHPMTGYGKKFRCQDRDIFLRVIREAAEQATFGKLLAYFTGANVDPSAAQASIAWLMKYAILEVVQPGKS